MTDANNDFDTFIEEREDTFLSEEQPPDPKPRSDKSISASENSELQRMVKMANDYA